MIKNCKKMCCTLFISDYIENSNKVIDNIRKFKSGIILHNTHEDKILLVQSRGNLWGFPKGSFEENENFKTCALRELKEETGISIDITELNKFYKINQEVKYFYVEYNENKEINIQNTNGNDANSIGWINLDCLNTLVEEGDIKLNFHAKKCLKKFFKFN